MGKYIEQNIFDSLITQTIGRWQRTTLFRRIEQNNHSNLELNDHTSTPDNTSTRENRML